MLYWFVIAVRGKPTQYKYLIVHALSRLGFVSRQPKVCITPQGVKFVQVVVESVYLRRGVRKRDFAIKAIDAISTSCCDPSDCEVFKKLVGLLHERNY